MKPVVFPLLLTLILAGCSAAVPRRAAPPPPPPAAAEYPLPVQNVDEPGDPAEAGEQLHSQHFFIGLDELLAGGSSEHLTRLSADGTAGRWQARARDLLAWSKRCAERPREPEGMSQLLRTCQTGSETLARENAALKSDLTQLKRILIEMETRKK